MANKNRVLILCTGNSCRSIMAEAILNKLLGDWLECESAGVNFSGKVNQNAKKVLEENSAWQENYYSKSINDVIDRDFDLVITVCDGAKEVCPIFPKAVPKIHVGFVDPDGKEFEVFRDLYNLIIQNLVPTIQKYFNKI